MKQSEKQSEPSDIYRKHDSPSLTCVCRATLAGVDIANTATRCGLTPGTVRVYRTYLREIGRLPPADRHTALHYPRVLEMAKKGYTPKAIWNTLQKEGHTKVKLNAVHSIFARLRDEGIILDAHRYRHLKFEIPGNLYSELEQAAKARDFTVFQLLEQLLACIVAENLFNAILDDQPASEPPAEPTG